MSRRMSYEMLQSSSNETSSADQAADYSIVKQCTTNKLIFCCVLALFSVMTLSYSATKFVSRNAGQLHRSQLSNRSFVVDERNELFVKDGEPFRFISGSIHYFRVPKIYWLDRLNKSRVLGLDAVQIDVPWNYHERRRGEFTFEGNADLEQFLSLAEQQGLLVIVRVGPYIGADWALGGLPPWLLQDHPNIKMRTSDPDFISAVQAWFERLLPKLRPFLYKNGGPIIMLQIENEYGSFEACDHNYLASLNQFVQDHLGSDLIVSTADVGSRRFLKCGSPFKTNLATVTFGPYKGDPDDKFTELFEFQPRTPWVNSEYYTGWMDHWGLVHFQNDHEQFIKQLISLLEYSPRISVNIYMVHGGTNFGFWNGAVTDPYTSQISSYDYDAPISEAGDVTNFYIQLRDALHAFKGISKPEIPQNTTKIAYKNISLYLVSHLLSHASQGINSMHPATMESIGQFGGFALYQTQLFRNPEDTVKLKFKDLADYAYVFTASISLDTLAFHGALSRDDRSLVLQFKPKFNTTDLLILTENAGYMSYSTGSFNDHKGILGPVSADGRELLGWNIIPVCLTGEMQSGCNNSLMETLGRKIHKFESGGVKISDRKPIWPVSGSIFGGILNIPSADLLADTFVNPLNFTRGLLVVNGEVVGKYNQALGPQLRTFVPKNLLRLGINVFFTIELDSLWLNETMNSTSIHEGTKFPLLFDTQMQWSTVKNRPVQ